MKADRICMQGGGYYNDNCTLQRRAIETYFTTFQPAPLEKTSVVLANYGSSEGHNSVHLLQRILEQSPSLTSATLVFNDTPSNDFTSLASTINTHATELTQNGKIKINPLMVPKSYFQQVLFDAFVDAGFSFTTLHWLRHAPSKGAENAIALEKTTSAHKDLISFLSARHAEIRPNGTLTLCIPGQGPIGIDATQSCLDATVRQLSSTYNIDPTFVARMPLYLRSMDEVLAGISAASDSSSGAWEVLESATVPIEHPACAGLMPTTMIGETCSRGIGGDELLGEEYASAMTGFAMAAVSSLLLQEVRASMGGRYPGDAEFLGKFRSVFKSEFLRAYCREKVGFTYLYLCLRRL